MTKEELIRKINNIIEFITNGKVERDNRVLNGHPTFYLLSNTFKRRIWKRIKLYYSR